MTRIALIGNSHLEAYKDALTDLSQTYPQATFHFFGLANPVFFQTDKLGGSALRLAQPLEEVPHQIIAPDGAHPLDLGTFDMSLLVGHGFFLGQFVNVMEQVDVIGFPATDKDLPMVSMDCLKEIMTLRFGHYLKRLKQVFGPLQNAVVLQAPFPVTEITTLDPARKRLHDHPARDAVFDIYQERLHETCWRSGIPFFPVVPEALDVPFFSKNAFGRHLMNTDGGGLNHSDCLHMNRYYAAQTLPVALDGVLPTADETRSQVSG